MKYDYKTADKVPCSYWITKEAEETLSFFAKQMSCSEDEALDRLMNYIGLTENCIPALKELGFEFDPKKAP